MTEFNTILEFLGIIGVTGSLLLIVMFIQGFYTVYPYEQALPVNLITGRLYEIEKNPGLHFAFPYIKVFIYDLRVRSLDIPVWGEIREGSFNIMDVDGVDLNLIQKRAVITYRLNPDKLKELYLGISDLTMLEPVMKLALISHEGVISPASLQAKVTELAGDEYVLINDFSILDRKR